jgi:hypothetical protein
MYMMKNKLQEAETMSKETKIEEVIERCLVDLIGSASRVNEYAEKKDIVRNCVNYGFASKSADVLLRLGKDVIIHMYHNDEGYLIVPQIIVDGHTTDF